MADRRIERRPRALAALLVSVCAMCGGCSPRPVPTSIPEPQESARPTGASRADASLPAPFHLVETAQERGIRFEHCSPLTEQRHSHLVMGSGVGWFDYDRDGWPDLFCCQGAAFDSAVQPATQATGQSPRNALFRNCGGTFVETAERAGLADFTNYAMGVAAADYDNDGFVDLCVTGYEENALYHNMGDGYFQRLPLPQGTQRGRWSASCAWGDIDADGNLDLFITNYADVPPENYPLCHHTHAGTTIHIVCHPSHLPPLPDTLCRNAGEGRFVDVSQEAGIAAGLASHGLGVVAADLDRDGDLDFYVANDTDPNQLWENVGQGRFVERGAASGVATNRHGAREAGMGVVAGDVDGNGEFDLFVANFYFETNTLYRNEGALLFTDVTEETGLGAPSRLRLGFGASLADFDGDSWPDLFVANGHIHDRLSAIGREEPFAQLPSMFRNLQGKRFIDVAAQAGSWMRQPHVARGSAVADFDRDGDADLAVSCLNGPAALLENRLSNERAWLGIELVGVASNRGGVGAVVCLDGGDRTLVSSVQAGCSYLSCDEGALLTGLGAREQVHEVLVIWPSGRRDRWPALAAKRYHCLVEGEGQAAVHP